MYRGQRFKLLQLIFPPNMHQEDLRVYYNYLYPFHTIVKWLTYNNRLSLSHRELSFQYEGVGVERYVKFNDANAMKNRMIDRYLKVPLKVDAGAIWDRIPQKQSNGKTVQRELIFDFDMNDYDDVRTCCTGKNVCVKCWKLLTIAVQILEKALNEDFDFHKIMYVFSGGRGLHIWVCDKRARLLKDSVRKSLVDYLELVTGNEKAASLLSEKVIHAVNDNNIWKNNKDLDDENREELKSYYIKNYVGHHVERSLQILKKHFRPILYQQQVLQHEKCRNVVLKILAHRNQKLKTRVQKRWEECKIKNTQNLLTELINEVLHYQITTDNDYPLRQMPKIRKYKRLSFIQQQIMLSFLYPRMDFNVSTMQNHLLKLPFSVHPTSTKISIPLFKHELMTFNPENCVTHKQLMKSLEQYQQEGNIDGFENQVLAEKTHLNAPIKAMQRFIDSFEE